MLTAPFKQWRKPNSICLVNVVFVFLFSMLLSQIYTAVVEAVLAGIECYAKTSTESKVNEALILYILTVDLLPYKLIFNIFKHPLPHMPTPPKKTPFTKHFRQLLNINEVNTGFQPVSLNSVKKNKFRVYLILPFYSSSSFLNLPYCKVRNAREVKDKF